MSSRSAAVARVYEDAADTSESSFEDMKRSHAFAMRAAAASASASGSGSGSSGPGVPAPFSTSYVGASGSNGGREDLSGVAKLLEGALAPQPQWARDVIGMHLRSCDRVRGASPSAYVIRLPNPISKVTNVQLSSISLPTASIYNIEDPATHIPVGVPLQPPDISEPLALTFSVQWRGVTPTDAAALANELKLQMTGVAGGFSDSTTHGAGRPFASVTTSLDDALQDIPGATSTFSIVLPPRINRITGLEPDPEPTAADYVRFTTERDHGLASALRSYRDLKLGLRVAGSALTGGVPELLPPFATLLAAGVEVSPPAPPLVEVIDNTSFRVHYTLLQLYSVQPTPVTPADLVLEMTNGTPLPDLGALYLASDMPTLPEIMQVLNEALSVARAAREVVTIPPPFFAATGGASDVNLTLPVLPDDLAFLFSDGLAGGDGSEARVVLEWNPGSFAADYALAGNVIQEGSVVARLAAAARSGANPLSPSPADASGDTLFLVGVVSLVASCSLAPLLGFPPESSSEPLYKLARLLCNPNLPAAGGVSSGFAPRGRATAGGRASGAFGPRGWAGTFGPRARTATSSAPRDALSAAAAATAGPTQNARMGIVLAAGACDGDVWRHDVSMRPGRYEEPATLCGMINERARGLTLPDTDARTLFVGDMGPAEAGVVLPPGDYDDEQLRVVLQAALRAATGDAHFYVDYVAVNVQALSDGLQTALRGCATTAERIDVTVGNGYPRRTRWRIANTSCNFSLRFDGAWARRMGFLRTAYRDASVYTSDEWAAESGLPFDFNASALMDAESVARIRFCAYTAPLYTTDGSPAPSRGFHRASLSAQLPVGDPALACWYSTLVPYTADVESVLGRALPGDTFAVKLTGGVPARRVLTVVVASAYAPSSVTMTPSIAFATSAATAVLNAAAPYGPAPESLPFIEPAGAGARFCLLFSLAARVSPMQILGFAPRVYPLDVRLTSGCSGAGALTPVLGTSAAAAASPALGRAEAALDALAGSVYCSGGLGVVAVERCIATVSASPRLLGDDSAEALAAAAPLSARADTLIRRFSTLVTSSQIDVSASLDSAARRRAMALMLHDAFSATSGGAGGGPSLQDAKQLSVSCMEGAFPLRLDSPRVLFMRIDLPGADNTRTQKYSTMVAGSQLYFFTKLSIGRGGGYTNISEQLMHTDLGSMNDVSEFVISFLKEDMTPVNFHGLEHDFSLLFSIRDARLVSGTQA